MAPNASKLSKLPVDYYDLEDRMLQALQVTQPPTELARQDPNGIYTDDRGTLPFNFNPTGAVRNMDEVENLDYISLKSFKRRLREERRSRSRWTLNCKCSIM